MMNRSPNKHRPQVQENVNQTHDYSEDDERDSKGLPEADISKLPPHLFQNLRKIKCTVGEEEGLTAEDLESVANGDGEVWIIQCPKYMDPSAVFSGKKISLGEDDISILNTVSESEGFVDFDRIVSNKPQEKRIVTYEALSLPSKGDADGLITLVPDSEGNRRIVAASVSGSIIVRESIEKIGPPTERLPRPVEKKELPPGLKYHHPIYGVDFSHAEDIDNKTDSDDEHYKNKSRKKKKSKSYDDSYSSPIKFNTKSKVDDCAINGAYSFNNDETEEYTESRKKKKKKRKKDEDTEYETQEETFVNPSERYPTANGIEEEELGTKKKKSKKRKREEDEDNSNEEYHPELNSEEICPPKSKKHKKNKSKHKSFEEMY